MKLGNFSLLDDQQDNNELDQLIKKFNNTDAAFPDKSVTELWNDAVARYPERTALIFGNHKLSYQTVDERANQYAAFLFSKGLQSGELVALLFEKSIEMVISILGVIKAGGAYLPMDPNSPFDRLRFTLEDCQARFLLGQRLNVKLINKLQWECSALTTVCCVDSDSFYQEREDLNELMKAELWDFISEKSHDDISGGGWFSSFTGEDIPRAEMDEYAQNVYLKLKPYLTPESKVLEVGCSFGITMFQVAKEVKSYYGTDLSSVAIEKTAQFIRENQIPNVQVQNLAAHEIDQVTDSGFDIVIINSVIQLFNGHNYLRDVLRKCLDLMAPNGVLFLGDLQDQDKKYQLIQDLKQFELENHGKGYQTKTDWSHELFISRAFLEDLCFEFDAMEQVQCSEKIHTLKNELTEYRFDALIRINKNRIVTNQSTKTKQQFDRRALDSQSISPQLPDTQPQQLLYVIYTSGSTGRPKGCRITHKNVVRLLFNDKLDFTFSEKDTWIMAHSYYFDFSVWEMYGALLYGGQLVIPAQADTKDIARMHHLVRKHHVSVLNQTPLSFNYFIEEEAAQAAHTLHEHLRYVIFGGDKLDPQKLIPWAAWYPLEQIRLINMYGITETTVHVTYYQLVPEDLQKAGVSPIGRPLPETRIYVLNEQQKPQPIGILGEMYVGGTGVCDGYLNREELTKERFIPNPFVPGEMLYRTGDQARWMADGTLEYQGRIDFQVKIRGYRIELGEIESRLNAHPELKQAVVIARQHDGQNELVAYYVADQEADTKVLRNFLKLELPDFMVPAFFIRISEIPLTSNGKLDKNLLPDPYLTDLRGGAAYVAPENETEEKLCAIWSEILGIEQVGATDNFFHIGGDSLKAIRVIVQINKIFACGLKVGDIFARQTIREFTELLEQTGDHSLNNDLEAGLSRIADIKQFIEENNAEDLPEAYDDIYPLSSIEKGMIFSSMLRPEEPVYYDQFSFRVHIRERHVFEHALHLLMQKHEILRAAYYMNRFLEPIKIILSQPDAPLTFSDLSALTHDEQQREINALIREDVTRRQSFEGELLWHTEARLLGDNNYFILFNFHHALLDGWSESSLITEFANLCNNPDVLSFTQLPAIASTYKDYTAIQLGRSVSNKAVNFWKSHMEGWSRNKLPFNLSGKKISDELGMPRFGKVIDREVSDKINALQKQLGVSHKAIFLAAYAWLMHLITSEQEIVSGCVSNDRPELEDGDKILGCFLNTLPFRVDFTSVQNRENLIRYFQDYLNEAKQNEMYLLDVAHAIGEKSAGGNPVFDCIFNYTDFHILEDVGPNNEALRIANQEKTSFELEQNNLMTNTLFDVEVDRTGGMLSISIKYANRFFTNEDAQRSVSLYQNILQAFGSNIHGPLEASELLDPAEKNWLLYAFNDTLKSFPDQMLMHELFEQAAQRYPQHVALKQAGGSMSYAELDALSNRFADLLARNGIVSGDKVAVISERHFDLIACLLGILKAGASYVPVDPTYPKDRQLYILNNANARVVLMDSNYEVIEDDRSRNYINIQEIRREDFSPEKKQLNKSSLDLAYTIYTSGSTGHPKGVMISHQAAVNLINWVNTTYEVGPDDCLLFITSICFDLSVYDIFGILATGASLVIADQEQIRDPEMLQKLMIEEKITFWDSVPTTMNYLVDMIEISDPQYRQEHLRLVFMSGDWIPVTLPERINRYFPNANNISLGGATEGTVWSNFYPIPKDLKHSISIPYGKPIDNNFFYILDDNRQPVPRGVAGELYIGGLGVAMGYSGDEEKTNAAFFTDPFAKIPNARMYKTGDLGRMLPDGNMEFLGRKDFQVKIRGFRVELGEIENQLQRHPAVKRAVVLAKDDGHSSKMLVAYVVCDQSEWNTDSFKKHLAAELPDYMLPGVYIRIPQVPVTSNGKIDRNALPDHQEFMEGKTIELPEPGIESQLADVWKELLGVKFISRHDSVFELGAHSLHAGAFVSRINKLYGYEMRLRDLFNNPGVSAQALLVAHNGKGTRREITPVAKADHYPLSFGQKRLWLLDTLQGGNTSEYNLPMTFELEGDFNTAHFEKAIQYMIDRHEILRTSLVMIDDEPRQQVQDKLTFELEIMHEGDWKTNAQALDAIITDFTMKPFDLNKAPMFRIRMLKLDEQRWILQLVMHHIISDGWSMRVMIDETMQRYRELQSGTVNTPEPLPFQYKDYANWMAEQVVHPDASEDRAYWLQQLAAPHPVLELPTDQPRPETFQHKGASTAMHLNEELSARVYAYCHEHQISTFTLAQAAVHSLLYLWSGQTDIRIGSAVSGRSHADLEKQIGFYVNTIVIRQQIQPDFTFQDLIEAMKNTVAFGLDHQHYPFDLLLDELKIKRSTNRNPLFDVMLTMQNVEAETREQEAVNETFNIRRRGSGLQVSKFDLSFSFYQSSTLQVSLEFDISIFHADTIGILMQHLTAIFTQIVEQDSVEIHQVEIPYDGILSSEAPEHEIEEELLRLWQRHFSNKLINNTVTLAKLGYTVPILQRIIPEIREQFGVEVRAEKLMLHTLKSLADWILELQLDLLDADDFIDELMDK